MTDVAPPRPRTGPDPDRLLPTPAARAAAVVLGALTVVHLAAQAAQEPDHARVTQWWLMPALALVVVCATAAPRSRLVRLVLLALGFSWLGDTVPDLFHRDVAFLVLVVLFLCAQLTYVAAFWPTRAASLTRRPPALSLYVLTAVGLVAACAPGAPGVLLAAVVVYGACLVAMAVMATGVHPLAGFGGAVFLASDAMIALDAFTAWFTPPVPGFWIMLTYVAGQALIVSGVLARERVPRR
ncbi:lysoplasmalogenase [Isoptericola variabilis]|uniref:lysoplasmalogenase n=1 Tax=Isoptericola variabilis TaxID=139208 RepID=UPI001C8F9623|nr:lysoplasmalogenase [Isoptericola variabilis]